MNDEQSKPHEQMANAPVFPVVIPLEGAAIKYSTGANIITALSAMTMYAIMSKRNGGAQDPEMVAKRAVDYAEALLVELASRGYE